MNKDYGVYGDNCLGDDAEIGSYSNLREAILAAKKGLELKRHHRTWVEWIQPVDPIQYYRDGNGPVQGFDITLRENNDGEIFAVFSLDGIK